MAYDGDLIQCKQTQPVACRYKINQTRVFVALMCKNEVCVQMCRSVSVQPLLMKSTTNRQKKYHHRHSENFG